MIIRKNTPYKQAVEVRSGKYLPLPHLPAHISRYAQISLTVCSLRHLPDAYLQQNDEICTRDPQCTFSMASY